MLPSIDQLLYSMALIIAFGLVVGTVLTLGVVPVLYSLLLRVAIPRSGADNQQ